MKKKKALSAADDDRPSKHPGKAIDPRHPGHRMRRPKNANSRQPDGQPAHAKVRTLPEEKRERLINEMVERVAAWFRSRAEEVLEEPHTYGKDLEDIRWQICGALAEDLENDYGEGIEDQIREAYTDAGLPTEVAGP